MAKRGPPTSDLPELSPGDAVSDLAASSLSPSSAQTAEYVASLTGELAELARKTGLDTLAHLLEMARFEAAAHIRGKSAKTV